MASWMVHLRIADKLLDNISDLSPVEFIVGNVAPDSGVPNEDWSVFTPSTQVSHFKTDSSKANPDAFAGKYFTPALQAGYSGQQYGFYLGYLVHLITIPVSGPSGSIWELWASSTNIWKNFLPMPSITDGSTSLPSISRITTIWIGTTPI